MRVVDGNNNNNRLGTERDIKRKESTAADAGSRALLRGCEEETGGVMTDRGRASLSLSLSLPSSDSCWARAPLPFLGRASTPSTRLVYSARWEQ